MSLAIATFRGALWNHGGKIIEYSLLYAASLVVARGLGVGDNGVYALVVSLSQLLLVASSFGLETVVNRTFPRLTGSDAPATRAYLLRRILVSRCAAFIAGGTLLAFLSSWIPALAGPAQKLIPVVIVFTFFRAFIPLLAMTLTAELRTDLTAWINAGSRAFELAVFAWKTGTGLTLPFVLTTLVVSSFFQLCAYLFVSRKVIGGPAVAVPLRPLLAFGGMFWTMTIVDYVLGRHGDVFFLAHLLPDPSSASLYDVAYSSMQLAQLGATAGLAGVTFAAFSRLSVQAPDSMAPFYHFLVRSITLLTVPLFSFLLFNADVFILTLYGGAYAAAAALVQGMAAFRILTRLFGGGENAEFILSLGDVGRFVVVGVISACSNALLNIFLIPSLHAGGSVIASGSANLLATILCFVLLRGRVRLQWKFWMSITALALITAGCVRFIGTALPLATLGLRFVVFALLTAGGIVLLRIASADDLAKLKAALAMLGTGASGIRENGK